MRVAGTFAIHGVTFSNPQWQETVDKLSERASGNPEQANAADAARVVSSMSGSFALANAMLDVPKLNYQMPGAQVDLAGKYWPRRRDVRLCRHGADQGDGVADADRMEEHSGDAAGPVAEEERRRAGGSRSRSAGPKSQPKLGLDLDKLVLAPTERSAAGRTPAQHP